jgi:hypothetical protein
MAVDSLLFLTAASVSNSQAADDLPVLLERPFVFEGHVQLERADLGRSRRRCRLFIILSHALTVCQIEADGNGAGSGDGRADPDALRDGCGDARRAVGAENPLDC